MINTSHTINNITRILAKRGDILLYLLFLNILSNLAGIYIHKGIVPAISMVILSFSSSLIEYLIIILIRSTFIRRFLFFIFSFLHNIIIILDYFLIINFQNIICQEVVDIISETNSIETQNFINTYIKIHSVLLWISCIIAANVILYKLAKWIHFSKRGSICISLLSFFGFLLWGIMIYSFLLYRNGMNIPQYHSVTRLSYSCLVLNERIQEIRSLSKIAQDYIANSSETPPDIIVIIGESSSIYHSQLYGYEKATSPLLLKRAKNKELAVYDDVVTTDDHTHSAMMSIFSLSSLKDNFKEKPLFPMCFKKAGYNVSMFDNQYFVGNGISFLSDQRLSELMFDKRNTIRYQYDGEMVQEAPSLDSPFIQIFHLWGQHYTYSERYPKEFKSFIASDYDDKKYSSSQREIIAHYDNAALYCDYVINEIIKKYDDKDCCIIFFSDHGEEVYDYRDFMGHGNSAHAREIKYQIRVPLLIWLSDKYKKNRPEISKAVFENIHQPFTTDNISHLILDLSGISCNDFQPSRSVINKEYMVKHRIVLHTMDFDSTN